MEKYPMKTDGIVYRNPDSFFGYCGWPSVCQDENGTLYAAYSGFRGSHICPFGKTCLTRSHDGGKTWSMPEQMDVQGSPPHLMVHSSGAVIMTFGRRIAPFGERAVVSYDNGRTWEREYVLRDDGVDGDLGYPATVELSDGSLITVYYQRVPGDRQDSILYTRWEL